jgi:hypothetical protein
MVAASGQLGSIARHQTPQSERPARKARSGALFKTCGRGFSGCMTWRERPEGGGERRSALSATDSPQRPWARAHGTCSFRGFKCPRLDVDEGECRASQVRNRLSSRTAVKAGDGRSRCIRTWRRTRQMPSHPTRTDRRSRRGAVGRRSREGREARSAVLAVDQSPLAGPRPSGVGSFLTAYWEGPIAGPAWAGHHRGE